MYYNNKLLLIDQYLFLGITFLKMNFQHLLTLCYYISLKKVQNVFVCA